MNAKERELAAKLLELASSEFSNHGCNDLDKDMFDGWSMVERQALEKAVCESQGCPERYDPDHLGLGDHELMDYFADRLRNIND